MTKKKTKTGKNRQDKFYHLAKEQGFRSRASFKLVQLNKRHDFLSSAARGVLDLCAAPGGWMQIARKHMPLHAPCIGIDLVPIRPIPGCSSLVGDITADTTRADLLRALREAHSGDKVDVVLNDGSPNMGKAWLQDAYTQSELTLSALKLSSEFLAPGGAFISKVFRSNDYNSLLFVMHQLFRRVHATKPSASRAESAEIYVMCLGFKAPKTIDPRLLNPKFVFKDLTPDDTLESQASKPDLFLNTVLKDMKKRRRNRSGYADGEVILFKKVSVLEFCRSERPVALIVDSSQFSFEPHVMSSLAVSEEEAKRIARLLERMPETSTELLSCCEDLKVLARREFKLLLKWRVAAREVLRRESLLRSKKEDDGANTEATGLEGGLNLSVLQGVTDDGNEDGSDVGSSDGSNEGREEGGEEDGRTGGGDEEGNIEDTKLDEDDEELDEQMRSLKAEQAAVEKRKKRKENKARNVMQRKIDMKIIHPEEQGYLDGAEGQGLFTLAAADRLDRKGVSITNVGMEEAEDEDEGYEGDKELFTGRLPSRAMDGEEADKLEYAELEGELDHWYKTYLSNQKSDKNGFLLKESKERKRMTKRRALREALDGKNKRKEEENGDNADQDDPMPELHVDSSDMESDRGEAGEAEEAEEEEPHPEPSAKQARDAAIWFSQDAFEGMGVVSSDDEDDDDEDTDMLEATAKGNLEGITENFHEAAMREAERMHAKAEAKKQSNADGFDIVANEDIKASSDDQDGEDSDSSFHSSDYDDDEKAEMIAIGKRMRQSKREANEVLDEAYHRYTFDDPFDMPRWFEDQDVVHRERRAPVKKEQVEEMKEYIKSLQAAPTKKEAEAKARRKARVSKKMEAMKVKANSIAEQSDVSVNSRMKAIEDLYKQAMKGGKGSKQTKKKVYQVVRPSGKMIVGKDSGKGRKALRGARTTLVDRRLKSDKRGIAKAQKRGRGKK